MKMKKYKINKQMLLYNIIYSSIRLQDFTEEELKQVFNRVLNYKKIQESDLKCFWSKKFK